MVLIYLTIGWLLGIWLASTIDWQGWVWAVLCLPPLAGAVLPRISPRLRWLFVLLLALAAGGWRYTQALPQIDQHHIAFYNGSREITLTGLVVDEPDIRDRFVNLRIATESMTLPDGSTQPVSGLVLVRTFRFPIIPYGTKVEVNGRLETPPQNEEFSYKAYLARQGIHSLISLPTITVLAEDQGNLFYQVIFTFKSQAEATIQRLLPNPHAALLTGILLGNDNGLPSDLADDFRLTGMTHIIAISG